MCRRAVCQSCRKVTYEGCGRHVEHVLAGVPTHQRCMCESAERKGAHTGEPMARTGPDPVQRDGAARRTRVPRRLDGAHGRSKDRLWDRLTAWLKSPA